MIRALTVILLTSVVFSSGCSTGRRLFNGKDTSGWVEVGSKGAWTAETRNVCPTRGPALKCSGRNTGYAWLSTDRKYGDFELSLQWRINPGGNTGVFCRVPDREGRASMKGFEIQARDDRNDKDLTDVSGAIFNRIPAAGRFAKRPGQWNCLRIICKGRHLRVELNGHVTVDADMDSVPTKGTDPPMKDVPDEGYIGLQNHGTLAEFRDIRIREIR